ncbi:urease accessory protein UreD [Methyloversatilis sp. XJ19-49]|uniref:urease accessory protein UreD n=1 Tax=Methyloversatilis sp. XJ19-49 TaxID=2963429 RepID=UPI00211BE71E|nr:urease accessory protein UreD [Methyloversatilis sp. XJ19-49]MCQ9379193.1 urease accessory protein UreD [Methyloversatilis sp. XJ19-49]
MTERHSFALDFGSADGRSFVARQYVRYPVHVGRALYTDPLDRGRCTVFLQSVSGGLFEHDTVTGRIAVAPGARAHVATPASTIVHTMRGGCATQTVDIDAADGAQLEYLPAPQILFPGSHLNTCISVTLGEEAVVLVSETFLAHDPTACAASFALMDSAIDITGLDGRLLARERMRIRGADWLGAQPGVSGAFSVQGSLWILTQTACAGLPEALRAISAEGLYAGASALPGEAGWVFRALAADAIEVGKAMAAARVAALGALQR